jgi:hypothetical protein
LQKRSEDLDERERRLKAKESSIKSRQKWSVPAIHSCHQTSSSRPAALTEIESQQVARHSLPFA